jgi:hypothetical protein
MEKYFVRPQKFKHLMIMEKKKKNTDKQTNKKKRQLI